MHSIAYAHVPQELKNLSQWCCRNGAKEPVNLDGSLMRWRDRANWLSFDQVAPLDKIGWFPTLESGIISADFDGCRNKETGEIHPLVKRWIEGTYAEITPSDEGVRAFFRGTLPNNKSLITKNVPWRPADAKENDHYGVELHAQGHYVTVTGNVIPGCPSTIGTAPDILHDILVRLSPRPKDRKRKEQTGNGWDSEMWFAFVRDNLDVQEELPDSCIITCPWAHEHSTPGDTAKVWFGPPHTFHCFHAHCAGREWEDVRLEIDPTYKDTKHNMPGALASSPGNEVGEKIQIVLGRQLSEELEDILDILDKANDPPQIFVRGGMLAHILADEDGKPRIDIMSEGHLLTRIIAAANFFRYDKKGNLVPAHPAAKHAGLIHSLGQWKFPPLMGLTGIPIVRPDGSILDRPGYDRATGLYYCPPDGLVVPSIPEAPTQEEARQAAKYIADFFCDFPFVDKKVDWTNVFGPIMTPFIRNRVRHVPQAVISATKQGTGKGLISDIVAMIGTGGSAENLSEVRSEEEWDKRVTALLMAGTTFITIDNVEGLLYSPTLAKVLTSDIHTGRVLGLSKMVSVPQKATWVVTGNNVLLGGDLPRRSYYINLATDFSNPWARPVDQLKYPKVLQTVEEERGQIIAAVLTMIRAWIVAGAPEPEEKLGRLGTMSDWVDIVGGTLAYAGVEGFLQNLDDVYEKSDVDGKAWARFLEMWDAKLGNLEYTTKELIEKLNADANFAETLPEPLGTLYQEQSKSLSRKFGKALAKKNKTPFGPRNLRIIQGEDSHSKLATYKVAGFAGFAGFQTAQGKNDFCDNVGNVEDTPEEPSVNGFSGEADQTPHTPHTPQIESMNGHKPGNMLTKEQINQAITNLNELAVVWKKREQDKLHWKHAAAGKYQIGYVHPHEFQKRAIAELFSSDEQTKRAIFEEIRQRYDKIEE